MTRLLPARPSTPCAAVFERLARDQDAVDPGLELAWNREIVHGRAEHDDIGRQKFVEHRLSRGDVRLQRSFRCCALAGGQVRTGQMRERDRRKVAIADFEAGMALPQSVYDGGGNLAADGVGAENTEIEMQEFHGWSPLVYSL